MLPVLVEADVPDETVKDNNIYTYLAGLLRPAIGENRPISFSLIKALLRSGRVLVIVDGLSERSVATREVFNPSYSRGKGFEADGHGLSDWNRV